MLLKLQNARCNDKDIQREISCARYNNDFYKTSGVPGGGGKSSPIEIEHT